MDVDTTNTSPKISNLFFIFPLSFCFLFFESFCNFYLHLPVSFRIYFGIFSLLLSVPPTDPETSSGWRTAGLRWGSYSLATPTSASYVIPNLFRNLFLLLSFLQRILKQVQDDGRRVKFFPSWLTLLFYGRGKRHENFPHQWSGRMKIFKCLPDRWVGFLRPTQYSDFLSETFYRSSDVKALRLIWNLNEPCGQSATEWR